MDRSSLEIHFLKPAQRARTMMAGALVLFLLLSAGLLSYQSNLAICELAKAKLENVQSPLGRELALGDYAVSEALVTNWKSAFTKAGIRHDVRLLLNTDPIVGSCTPGIFRADFSYPVGFAGKQLAVFSGSASHIPVGWFIAFLVFSSLLSMVILWYWNRRVTGQIRQNLKSQCLESEKKDEELLRSLQLNELASRVAHDIRSPLSLLNILVDDISKTLPDRAEMLASAVDRISEISSELLARRRATHESAPRIVELLAEQKRLEYADFGNVAISVTTSLDTHDIELPCSPAEMRRILSNLVDNAVEAMPDGGQVGLSVNREGKDLILSVTDTGKGFGNLPPKAGGNGIGLSSAKKFVEEQGGSLSIERVVPNGARIQMRLPLPSPL